MDQKVVFGALFSIVLAVLSWMASTTLELKLSVQRLEIILLDDAMVK